MSVFKACGSNPCVNDANVDYESCVTVFRKRKRPWRVARYRKSIVVRVCVCPTVLALAWTYFFFIKERRCMSVCEIAPTFHFFVCPLKDRYFPCLYAFVFFSYALAIVSVQRAQHNLWISVIFLSRICEEESCTYVYLWSTLGVTRCKSMKIPSHFSWCSTCT